MYVSQLKGNPKLPFATLNLNGSWINAITVKNKATK